MQGLLSERRRHLRLGDQLELDRQRAEPQLRGEILRRADREAAGDVGALIGRDPVRELLEVDLRDRDQLRVERDREVLVLRVAQRAVELAAMRDVAGDPLEGALAVSGEAERDVGVASRVGALLRVGDVVAEQRDVVLEHVELGGGSLKLSGCVKFLGTACRIVMPRGTARISPSDALTPGGSPWSRSCLVSLGPDSRQSRANRDGLAVGLGGGGTGRRCPARRT